MLILSESYSYLCIINKFLVELSRLIFNYSLRFNTSNLFLLVDEANIGLFSHVRYAIHKLVVVNIVFTVLCMSWFELSLDS